MQALCLSDVGPYRGMYTTAGRGCEAGKPNTYGAVDSPGEEEEIAALYAEDDAVAAELAKAIANVLNESLASKGEQ